MKIEKEIFYHANSGDFVQVGDVLTFQNLTPNKMMEDVYQKSYLLNDMDANQIMCNKRKNQDTPFTKEEFDLILNTVNHDAYVMRELALEEVRKEKYPDYPSRLHCLYVTKEKEDANDWVSILKRNQKVCKQLLTLELTGELFIGDGNLMKRQNLSYQEHLDVAEKYWAQETNEINEYLFCGEAKVIAVDNID